MQLLLGESSGATGESVDCGGLCQTDFDDVRFTAADGTTLLEYCIKSISGTTPNQLATISIEFDSIGTGDTTFYMYFGKADATAVSNGANTFIAFDNFEWGSNNDSVADSGGSVTWTAENGAIISTEQEYTGIAADTRSVKFPYHASGAGIRSTQTASDNIAISWREYKENAADATTQFVLGNGSKRIYMAWRADEKVQFYNGSTYVDTGATASADTWHLFELKNLNFTAGTYDIYLDNSIIKSGASMGNTTSNTNQVVFKGDTTASGRDLWLDNFIIRNWRSTEPAWGSWGGLEENPAYSADITETATFKDEFDGTNDATTASFSETATFTDAAEGDILKESTSESAVFTDTTDASVLKESTSESITLTDAIDGQDYTDKILETVTITDAWSRQFEVERETPGETATITDLIEGYPLVDTIPETVTIDDRMFGDLGNAIRRKQMLWDLQNEHIQIKFSHNQAHKCAQAEDVAIRTGLIRRQDTTRLDLQGDHLSLKFQHNELGETLLLKMLAVQIQRVSNLFSIQWHDAARLVHQGNHLALKIQHNTAGETVLIESMGMMVNQVNNPTTNWSR